MGASEIGDEIELKAVQLQFPSARTLDKNESLYQVNEFPFSIVFIHFIHFIRIGGAN